MDMICPMMSAAKNVYDEVYNQHITESVEVQCIKSRCAVWVAEEKYYHQPECLLNGSAYDRRCTCSPEVMDSGYCGMRRGAE